MHKKHIYNAGIGGGRSLNLRDVATVDRSKRVVKLRHQWPDNVDGRVWDAIRRTYRKGSQDLANQTGRSVEVYTKDGHVLEQYAPEEEFELRHTATRRSR